MDYSSILQQICELQRVFANALNGSDQVIGIKQVVYLNPIFFEAVTFQFIHILI